jgi:hypothetical protein
MPFNPPFGRGMTSEPVSIPRGGSWGSCIGGLLVRELCPWHRPVPAGGGRPNESPRTGRQPFVVAHTPFLGIRRQDRLALGGHVPLEGKAAPPPDPAPSVSRLTQTSQYPDRPTAGGGGAPRPRTTLFLGSPPTGACWTRRGGTSPSGGWLSFAPPWYPPTRTHDPVRPDGGVELAPLTLAGVGSVRRW